IDPARHQVLVNGKPVELTSLEFKLLRTLMQRRGRVQERDRLLNEVWGYESVIDTRTVDTHVRRLREKLGKAGDVIETVRGFGYRVRGYVEAHALGSTWRGCWIVNCNDIPGLAQMDCALAAGRPARSPT